jgi:hypothetical protein
MRMTGQDEPVDAESHVFPHAVGDLPWVADKRRACAAANQADARP